MTMVCQKCGRMIKPGQLTYHLRIQLTSMYDNCVREPGSEFSTAEVDRMLERLIDAVSRQDPDDVLKDVMQSMELVICRQCRNELVRNYDPDEEKTLH
jgi:hypothetical protein